MVRIYFLLVIAFFVQKSFAQTNIHFTKPTIQNVLEGNYNPDDYQASTVIDLTKDIIESINSNISTDSLQNYLTKLSEFGNRNTGSDTISTTFGIGASRRWVHQKFENFSAANEDRLIPGYLQFDQVICTVDQHRNVVAVLPGSDVSDPSFILIEGHMDSRCAEPCDGDCPAEGVEDNASGTALVIELARVMSQYTFEHTIVFMATIGEEQGLFGANALADHALNTNLSVKAVLNNDIVGGIICGETSSAPSCPGEGLVDSTQVRLFSLGSTSIHKNLSRFIKLEYKEELLDLVSVPMMLTIMSAEDRTGRGGDHIPFRQNGFAAMRFTSAHEHGDASNGPDYHDRQHTSGDILGVDTNGDNVIDSFFVDFNYLARNAVINGAAAAAIASGPETPSFETEEFPGQIKVTIDDPLDYDHYRITLRSASIDWDTVFTIQNTNELTFEKAGILNFVSVASVDEFGIESLFTSETQLIVTSTGTADIQEEKLGPVTLFQNRPNPFDEATIISWNVNQDIDYKEAFLQISSLDGKVVKKIPVTMNQGSNELLYEHGYGVLGTYVYALVVDGKVVQSRKMVFAN